MPDLPSASPSPAEGREREEGPAATVVIPAYNASAFIAGALASAAAQTERRIEILVVDDGSTDDTAAVVERFSRQDARVRLLRTPRNAGPAAARNLGFAAARGEWIAVLDADDSYAPERLEALLALAEERGADMVADNLLRVFEGAVGRPEPLIPTSPEAADFEMSLTRFFEGNLRGGKRRASYGYLQPMFRRSFLERHGLRFDEWMRLGEDFAFFVACLRAGAVWWVSPRPMYRCLVRPGSLSEAHGREDVERLLALDEALLQGSEAAADPRLARAVGRHAAGLRRYLHYRPFTDALKARDWGGAARVLFGSAAAFRQVAAESARQAPAVLAKALAGGYARRAAAVEASS